MLASSVSRLLRLTIVVTVIALCAACPGEQLQVHGAPFAGPAYSTTLHGDTSFTTDQRLVIIGALQRLQAQTQGLFAISVVFDLDFNSIQSLKEHYDDDMILAIDSNVGFVEEFDSTKGCCLLGLTVHGQDVWYASDMPGTKIFIIMDRMVDDQMLTSVVMHEAGHAAMLEHTWLDSRGLMTGLGIHHPPTTCLHKSDAQEIARVYNIDPSRILTCD